MSGAASRPRHLQRRLPRRWLVALVTGLGCAASGCERAAPISGPVTDWSRAERALIASLGLPLDRPLSPPPAPGNRYADDPAAAALGQPLFFDRRLSGNGQVACSTCHDPSLAFTDGRPLARGIGDTARHAPTVLGAAHLPFLFWDGRKDSLWAQAGGPLESEVEHGTSRAAVAQQLARHYRARYEAVFGPLPPDAEIASWPPHARPRPDRQSSGEHQAWLALPEASRAAIDRAFVNAGKAIEAYERRLQPRPAPFDRFAAALASTEGGKPLPKVEGFEDAASRGLRAFLGDGGCVHCHNGPLFSDEGFHNLGLPRRPGASGIDVGRTLGAQQVKADPSSCGGPHSDTKDCAELRHLNPRFEDFLGAFKTPTLRQIATTAPYMHDGRFSDLAAVIDFYQRRPGKAEIGHRDLIFDTLAIDQVDAADLVAFLRSLSGPLPDAEWMHPHVEMP